MSYYDTIAEDLTRAKQILADGKMRPSDLSDALPPAMKERMIAQSGHISVANMYAAYKLLESFVEEIERLQRALRTSEASRRQQFALLARIRTMADAVTGIQRDQGDERDPGALGAVTALIERCRKADATLRSPE